MVAGAVADADLGMGVRAGVDASARAGADAGAGAAVVAVGAGAGADGSSSGRILGDVTLPSSASDQSFVAAALAPSADKGLDPFIYDRLMHSSVPAGGHGDTMHIVDSLFEGVAFGGVDLPTPGQFKPIATLRHVQVHLAAQGRGGVKVRVR